MTQKLSHRFHVSTELGPIEIATSIFSNSPTNTWYLAMPGGSYTGDAYYDKQIPGCDPETFSMARYLAHRGIGVVTVDHPGTGQSTIPEDGATVTRQFLGGVYAELVPQLKAWLQSSGLASEAVWLGAVGHSMGGFILTHVQGEHQLFDAVQIAGWSNADWVPDVPVDNAQAAQAAIFAAMQQGYLPGQAIRQTSGELFYSPAVSQELIHIDEEEATNMPAGLTDSVQPGIVQEQARRIVCPVLLTFGEVDIITAPKNDPRREPHYYGSDYITLYIQSGARHCANFGANQSQQWERVCSWIRGIAER